MQTGGGEWSQALQAARWECKCVFCSKRNITARAVSKCWHKKGQSIWTRAPLDCECLLINTLQSDIFQWPMWPKIKRLPVQHWINSLMRGIKAFIDGGKSCCPIERRCCWRRGKGCKQVLQLSATLQGSDLTWRGVGAAPRLADCLCEGRVTLAEACTHGKGGQRLKVVHMWA